VALSCCRQASTAGHEVTLLVRGPLREWLSEYAGDFAVESLNVGDEEVQQTPRRFVEWLEVNPQDVVFINDVAPTYPALSHIAPTTRLVFVVHDTARMYWLPMLENESHLDAAVAVSNVVARRFRDKMEEPNKLHVAHNGTLFPDGVELDRNRNDDLVFLGGSKHIKGAYDVLPLWEALVDRGFEGGLRWFGNLDQEFQSRIRRATDSDRIQIHGHVPRSKVFEAATMSKVTLVLSRSESFGMATVECMGMGCLPVAWDIETGTTEIATDGDTGFFAPLGDTEALADRVLTAIDRHEDLCERVVEHVRSEFSEQAMWSRYEEILDDVMSRPKASRPEAEAIPPEYEPPTRYFQLLPDAVRQRVRKMVGHFPRLGYLVRNLRGY